jgi:acetoin utilization protein AcuB
MSAPPVGASPDTPIPDAREILRSHHFRHLPIIDDDDHLVGIVTDRDLRSAYPSSIAPVPDREEALKRLAETPVHTIMTRNPVVLACDATLDDALFLFDDHSVGAMPVVDRTGYVVGMFSAQDLIKAYNTLFGLGERGSALIGVVDDGQPRILSRIVDALDDQDVPVARLVRLKAEASSIKKDVIYLRVRTYNVHGVYRLLRAAGLQISTPNPEDPCKSP